jgi:hypothetical protein
MLFVLAKQLFELLESITNKKKHLCAGTAFFLILAALRGTGPPHCKVRQYDGPLKPFECVPAQS